MALSILHVLPPELCEQLLSAFPNNLRLRVHVQYGNASGIDRFLVDFFNRNEPERHHLLAAYAWNEFVEDFGILDNEPDDEEFDEDDIEE